MLQNTELSIRQKKCLKGFDLIGHTVWFFSKISKVENTI